MTGYTPVTNHHESPTEPTSRTSDVDVAAIGTGDGPDQGARRAGIWWTFRRSR